MKISHALFLAVFICNALFITCSVKGQTFPVGGTVGTPITFTIEIGCNQSGQVIATWDFGSGAAPPIATTSSAVSVDVICPDDPHIGVVGFSQVVTYSTPGDKLVKLSVVEPGGTGTSTSALHIYDCSIPSIPHDAIVINSDTTINDSGKTYWVNPGYTVSFSAQKETVFAEAGSTISGVSNCIVYMKQGTVSSSNGGRNSVIFGDGASINSSSSDFILNCPTLDFDYSNAPPNAAHPTEKVDEVVLQSITLFPNPTNGVMSIQGIPSGIKDLSVLNILGETMMDIKNPQIPDFTLDLSKLIPGTYYIRFSSPNSVVTRMVIKN